MRTALQQRFDLLRQIVIEDSGQTEGNLTDDESIWAPDIKERITKLVRFGTFQQRVRDWVIAAFGETVANDVRERNHRFIEEALELVQSLGLTRTEALTLVEYVYSRPAGEPPQEVGGVMTTLNALCGANGMSVEDCAEAELARIGLTEVMERIRVKQAGKPRGPIPTAKPVGPVLSDELNALIETNSGVTGKLEGDVKELVATAYAVGHWHGRTPKPLQWAETYPGEIYVFGWQAKLNLLDIVYDVHPGRVYPPEFAPQYAACITGKDNFYQFLGNAPTRQDAQQLCERHYAAMLERLFT